MGVCVLWFSFRNKLANEEKRSGLSWWLVPNELPTGDIQCICMHIKQFIIIARTLQVTNNIANIMYPILPTQDTKKKLTHLFDDVADDRRRQQWMKLRRAHNERIQTGFVHAIISPRRKCSKDEGPLLY